MKPQSNMLKYPSDESIHLSNEVLFKEFYSSGEPEATRKYRLQNYQHRGVLRSYDGDGVEKQHRMWLTKGVTDPGEMLIVENCLASCECIGGFFPCTEQQTTHAPATVLSQALHRIPSTAYQHLAHKFAEQITGLMASASDENTLMLESIGLLDAGPNPSACIPVNLQGGMNTESSPEKRGPWKEVEADVEKTLDYERVWNIIANNARCFKVRSKRRGEPSQVETCELWGMWLMTSFINHSCRPNCHAMRVGDAIIIRAARALSAQEELTLPYFDIFQPLRKRELDAQRWGFRCCCVRCEFEGLLEESYDTIQEKILNLEGQIQRSRALNDVEIQKNVTRHLLKDLLAQVDRIENLVELIVEPAEGTEITYLDEDKQEFFTDSIWASFSEPLLAWYVLCQQEAHKDFGSGHTELERHQKAESLGSVITSVTTILGALTNVHPGNLLCEELYDVLIKARLDLVYEDLDENLKNEVDSQESYVRRANEYCACYYGPHVQVFQLMNR